VTGVEGPVPVRIEGAPPVCIATIPANPAAPATTTAGARLILRTAFVVVVRRPCAVRGARSQGVDLEMHRVLRDSEPQNGCDYAIHEPLRP